MDFTIPIGRFKGLEDATLIIRPDGAVAVGRGPSGYDEVPVTLDEAAEAARPYAEAYDEFLAEAARALGGAYEPAAGGIAAWLTAHVRAVEALGAKWARVIDSRGPFSIRRSAPKIYIPYMGSSITATYVKYPYENAVVVAENVGRAVAIGSVVVEWGGVGVYKGGLRTLPGAAVLAQAAPELAPPLPAIAEAVARLALRISQISQ
jgi:hypothetical protein|nr:MAG: hypothetical protein TU35_00660 [Thermoproteus sp. AZ2]